MALPLTPALHALLRRALWRRRWLGVLEGATWGLAAGTAAALTVVVFHRLIQPDWPLDPVAGGLLVAGPLVGVIASLARRRDSLDTALALERGMPLYERLSSILLLGPRAGLAGAAPAGTSGARSPHAGPTALDEAHTELLADGDRWAAQIDLRRALPLARPAARWPAGVLVAALFVAYVWLPAFDLLGAAAERAQDAERTERVQEQRKQLEKRLAELRELAEKQPIAPETRRLLAKLEERPHEIATGSSEEQKKVQLAEMNQVREGLEARKQELGDRLGAFERVQDQLRAAAARPRTEAVQQLSEALERGDLAQAASQLAELARQLEQAQQTGASPAQAAELQQELGALLKKLGQDGLSAELSKNLLEKLGPGAGVKPSDLAKLADSAAGELEQLARLLRESELVDRALDEIQLTQDELAALPREWPQECPDCAQEPGGT